MSDDQSNNVTSDMLLLAKDAEITRLRAEIRELHMKGLADLGQAQEAHEARLAAEAEVEPVVVECMDNQWRTGFNAGIEAATKAAEGVTGWVGKPHQSSMDFGPYVSVKIAAAIRALRKEPE